MPQWHHVDMSIAEGTKLDDGSFDRLFGWTPDELQLQHPDRSYPIRAGGVKLTSCQCRYDREHQRAIVRSLDGVCQVFEGVIEDEAADNVCRTFARMWIEEWQRSSSG